MRLYNSVARALISDSAEFEPLFVAGDSDAASAQGAGPALDERRRSVGGEEKIYAFWAEKRQALPPGSNADRFPADSGRGSPRAASGRGRDDLCPCGSGRKFKRCCGAKPTAQH